MLIRVADCPTVAWKNGGGTTQTIATVPADASIDDFRWRLSIAQVDTPGTFSHFAGIDRTMAILSGRLRLEVAGRDPALLDPDSGAYDFPGDVACFGTPVAGRVVDLNLMVRRDYGRGTITTAGAGPILGIVATTIVIATRDTLLRIGTRTVAMQAHDAFRLDASPGIAPTTDMPMTFVTVTPHAGS